jgi:hypothetical protein
VPKEKSMHGIGLRIQAGCIRANQTWAGLKQQIRRLDGEWGTFGPEEQEAARGDRERAEPLRQQGRVDDPMWVGVA